MKEERGVEGGRLLVSGSLSSELCRPERGEGGRETWGEEGMEERRGYGTRRGGAERGDCDVSSPAPTARMRGLQMEGKEDWIGDSCGRIMDGE